MDNKDSSFRNVNREEILNKIKNINTLKSMMMIGWVEREIQSE